MFIRNIMNLLFTVTVMLAIDEFNPLLAKSKSDFHHLYIENSALIPLEEKIAQMLIVGFSGDIISLEVKSYIQDYKIGGVILFSNKSQFRESNITSSNQLIKLIKELKNLSSISLLISLDQEGGKVAKLNKNNGFSNLRLPSHQQLAQYDNSYLYQSIYSMAKELKSLGFDIKFAPVVDVNVNFENPVIGKLERSFSANPLEVASKAAIFIKAQKDAEIIPVIKHFPGHGSSKEDSHLGFTEVTNTYQEDIELEPYKILINSGYDNPIMISHIFNKHMDDKYPASLSYNIITGLLKNKLGFKGLIITDDLKMGAITRHYSLKDTLILAINAGSDMLIYGNNIGEYNPTFVKDAVEIIKKAIAKGELSIDKINESYLKIMETKYKILNKSRG
ncbi:Glycoside hydrolase family 3 protein [Candidatus Hepatincolaceae symbiont of Richtersius coronifer]